MTTKKPLQASPLVVNRVLNKVPDLRGEVGGQQRPYATHVVAYGPRAKAGEAATLLATAEKTLKAAGYKVELRPEDSIYNSYLIVAEGTSVPVPVKLTEPQIRIMRAIRETGSAYVYGMNGGGRDQSVAALRRKDLAVWEGRDMKLTEAGNAALDAVEAAEEARMQPRRVLTMDERIANRVHMAAAKFIAESRDGNVPPEPTDENLAQAYARAFRPIKVEYYPAVRARVEEIRAERA